MPKDFSAETKIAVTVGKPVELPSGEFVSNATFTREGTDLHMTSPDGQSIVIEGYFNQSPHPDITTADGAHLGPEMVDAFLPPERVGEYAENSTGTASDVSPAGKITEVVGEAVIVHADGTKTPVEIGMAVYPGDVIETSADGAVNILFADNTTFAISESARLSIDQFSYNAAEQEGTSFFSMLQGMFVYTSGMIGKNDPGNVNIETPIGSIGIRGTVVAGEINPAGEESKITIVDGAIVLTNDGGTLELNDAFETASVSSYTSIPTNLGQIDTTSFAQTYQSVSQVAAPTFDAVGASHSSTTSAPQETAPAPLPEAPAAPESAPAPAQQEVAPETQMQQAPQETAPDATQGTVAPPPTAPQPVFFAPPPPPPPPAGTEFTATGTSSFGGAGDFSGTAVQGTGTVTFTAVPPPPPPPPPPSGETQLSTTVTVTGATSNSPPPPDVNFVFSNYYTRGTMGTSDDAVPFLGGAAGAGTLIGQFQYQNLPTGSTFNFLGFDTGGNIQGNVLANSGGFNYTMGGTADVFHLDSATGALYLLNPLGVNWMNASNISFGVEVRGPGGAVIATETVTLRIETPPVDTTLSSIRIGDDTSQASLVGTTGSDVLFGRGGDDNIIGGLGADTLLGGTGNDTMSVVNMGFMHADGGIGLDKLTLGQASMTRQVFDFRSSDNVKNIETLSIQNSNTNNGNDIYINIRDVFEMTDAAHTLTIGTAANGYAGSVVNIDNSDTGLADLAFIGSATDGSSDVLLTYRGVFNGSTVTLIINTGNGGSNEVTAVVQS